MGYALAAIPIWFSKIAITTAGLAAVTNIGQRGLGTIVRFFEKLMFFDFSGIFSGNSNNSDHILNYDGSNDNFRFFPSPSSPFFILWIVFFSAGVLLIILSIIYTLVSRMNNEDDKESFYISKLFTNIIGVIVTIFFIPFMLFSSMTITSTAVKALFKSNSSTASKQSINEYKSNFLNQNIEAINNMYNLGKNNTLTMKDGSPNALYSHSDQDNKDSDKFIDNVSNKSPTVTTPFTSYNDILSRLNYELTFLEKNNSSYFDSTTQLLISQTKQDLEKYQKDWIINKKIINNLKSITLNIPQLSYNKKNQTLSTEMDNLANNIKKYHLATLKLFNQLREIISKKQTFRNMLKDNIKKPVEYPFYTKLDVLMTTNNKTVNIDILKEAIKHPSHNFNNKQKEQFHKLASFINIYSLTKVYIAPKSYKTIEDWKKPLTFKKAQDWNPNKTLMASALNMHKMLIGYKYGKDIISYKYLASAFSDFKKTSLSEVVDEIGSFGLGDPVTIIVMIFVQWSILIMVFSIVFVLYKRLLERLIKLIWLWISGPIVMSTAIKSGSQSIRNWFSMVMTEMIVLISLGLGWAIWKQLTPILFNWIAGETNTSQSTTHIVGDALTFGLVSTVTTALNPGHIILKIFIALGLLGLVIKTSDWLLEALGGSTRLRDISSNVRGDLNRRKQNISQQKKDAINTVRFNQKQKNKAPLYQKVSSKGINKPFDRNPSNTKT